MLAVATYLANKPTGLVQVFLLIAVILFVIGAIYAAVIKPGVFWASIISGGLAALVLAFLVHG